MQKNTISPEVLAGATALLMPYFQGLTAETLVQKLKTEPQTEKKSEKRYTIADTATFLGVSEMTVHRLLKAGKLPKVKVSDRLVRIPEAAIQSFLNGEVKALGLLKGDANNE